MITHADPPVGPVPPAPLVFPGAEPLTLQGEAVQLLPDPALWWPAQHTLCVADVHLGKAATFRARGVPVPLGTTRGTLARLDAALAASAAGGIVFTDFSNNAPTLRPRHIFTKYSPPSGVPNVPLVSVLPWHTAQLEL